MANKTQDYDAWLVARLKDPKEATSYLSACLADAEEGDFEEVLLLALRQVAKAYGMSNLAERANLSRESLYRSLSEKGDPKLRTITAVLDAFGLQMTIGPKRASVT